MEVLENPPAWELEAGTPTVESTETVAVDDERQITQRYVKIERTGAIVEFAVVYSKLDSEGCWQEILCIDTRNHGTVHRHWNGDHTVREDIEFIASQETIQNGFWDAVGEVYDVAYGEGV